MKVQGYVLFIVAAALATSVSAFEISSAFGNPKVAIVTEENPAPHVKKMAEELTNYLGRITGATFRIAKRPVGGLGVIRLGTPYHGKMDEFAVFVNKKGELELTGEGPRGTVYATYALLEELGVRFWAPDQETVPQSKRLSLPVNFKRVEAPAFEVRSIWGDAVLHQPWCPKLRVNAAMHCIHKEYGGEYSMAMGETLTFNYLSRDKYFKDHPDWYALRYLPNAQEPEKGRVRAEIGATPGSQIEGIKGAPQSGVVERDFEQICTTNPDALEQLLAEIRAELSKNPATPFIAIGMNDNDRFCQCQRCAELARKGGGKTAVALSVANLVARSIASAYPKTKVCFLAYWLTEKPPTNMKCEPNVCIGFGQGMYLYSKGPLDRNGGEVQRLEDWSKAAPGGVYIWAYYACFADYLVPYYDYDYMGPNFRLYKKNGVRGISPQLPWGVLSDFVDLRCWLFGQLAWNPEQDEDKLIGEWIDGTCGKGAPAIHAYLALQREIRARHGRDFCNSATADDYLKARELVDTALKATEGDAAAHRRIEKIYAGLLAETILRYDGKKLGAAAKAKGVSLPTRRQLVDEMYALGRKLANWSGKGECMIAWKEGQWNFDTFMKRLVDLCEKEKEGK